MLHLIVVSFAAQAAPATVLSHEVEWTLGPGDRLTRATLWEIRVDDPAACTAGLRTPAGLDGAMVGGARVIDDLLFVPPSTADGDIFRLAQRETVRSWERSGTFSTVPGLPVVHAKVVVRSSGDPLSLWHDESGWLESIGDRRAEVTWSNVHMDQPASLTWTTWSDWFDAGARLVDITDARLGRREDLGKALAESLGAVDLATIAERVHHEIALEPGGAWDTARPVSAVVESGTGTAHERALVLVNLIRLAGYEAWPGGYAPPSTHHLPVTLPAPALTPHPLVVIERAGDNVYVDPAADSASVPTLPAMLQGGVAWKAGSLPIQISPDAMSDGEVQIISSAQVGRDRSLAFRTDLSADGGAPERIRTLLRPLSTQDRVEAISRIVRAGHPEVGRLEIEIDAVERPSRPLRITISGTIDDALGPSGGGLAGRVTPILAPTLAAWLPPNLRVTEQLTVTAPSGYGVLALAPPPTTLRAHTLVSRTARRDARRATVSTEVQRLQRTTTAAQDARAAVHLADAAQEGTEVLLYPAMTPTTRDALRADTGLSDAERQARETLLWLAAREPAAARRSLKKRAKNCELTPVIEFLRPMISADRAGLIELLHDLAQADGDRLRVTEALSDAGLRRDAWELAFAVHTSEDTDARFEALLQLVDLQVASAPSEEDDPVGHAMWHEPLAWIAAAEEIRTGDPRTARWHADRALELGDIDAAEAALPEDTHADTFLLRARMAVLRGDSREDVTGWLDAVRDAAPDDPAAALAAADIAAQSGNLRGARDHALAAARVGVDDLRSWREVVDRSLVLGDLHGALAAAHTASDAAPGDPGGAGLLLQLATLAGDVDAARIARDRGQDFQDAAKDWPIPLAGLFAETPIERRLALLRARDVEVVADASMLHLRARDHLAAGMLDEAARDGLLLATLHRDPAGHAIRFAAVAGRGSTPSDLRRVRESSDASPEAGTAVLEYDLITGARAPSARSPSERGAAILAAMADPTSQGAWSAETPEPTGVAPAGMRPNAALDSAVGVRAWSDAARGLTVIRVGASTDALPPPLDALYEQEEVPHSTTEAGEPIFCLSGGFLPLFVARHTTTEGSLVLGIGFTPTDAAKALTLGK